MVKADTWFQRNNLDAIGPRIGIAWSPFRKTVVRTGYGIAFDTVSSFQVTAVAGRVTGLTASCASTVGGATSPGCQSAPDLRINEGFPEQLNPPTTKPSAFIKPALQTLTNAPAFSAFDPQIKIPTVHQWNLNIQQELPGGFVGQVGYIARRGTRLFRACDLNQVNSDGILDSFTIMQGSRSKNCKTHGRESPSRAGPYHRRLEPERHLHLHVGRALQRPKRSEDFELLP